MGSFPFNKNSVFKFQKFHVFNGTVHSGCSDPTQATARLVIVLVSRIQKSGTGDINFFKSKKTFNSVRPTPIAGPIKVDHLQSCSQIFRSDQTQMVRSISCTNRNFGNFGLNGKRAYSRGHSNKSQNSE